LAGLPGVRANGKARFLAFQVHSDVRGIDLLRHERAYALQLRGHLHTGRDRWHDRVLLQPGVRAVIAKMPLAAKNTLSEMQQRMQQMIPKLQQMAREAAEAVKAKEPAKKSG
jgi:hypothetical protein